MCMCVEVHMRTWRPVEAVKYFPLVLLPYSFKRGSHGELEAKLAGQWAYRTFLSPPLHAGVWVCAAVPCCFMWCWDLSSGPHPCIRNYFYPLSHLSGLPPNFRKAWKCSWRTYCVLLLTLGKHPVASAQGNCETTKENILHCLRVL